MAESIKIGPERRRVRRLGCRMAPVARALPGQSPPSKRLLAVRPISAICEMRK